MARKLISGEYVVGVDIGGTKMLAAVLDYEFKIVAANKIKSKSNKKSEPAEDRIRRVVQGALDESGVSEIVGIGVGSPGPLDPKTGIIIDTPNLGWKNFPLADVLADHFKVPTVVDNDVNVGTYGEWRFGDVKKAQNVIGIFPGTGIGGGIIIDGKLLHGATGAAGEIGHMTMQVDGPYCGCGKRGCLEAIASRVAVAAEIAALAAREDAPNIKANCGSDLDKIKSGAIARAIAAGDRMVEQVVRRAAFHVGIAVGNLINILSPEAVVLGGGMVEAMEDIYLEEVGRAVKQHAMPFLRKNVKITAAKLGDHAVVMGAGQLLLDRIDD